MRSQKSGVRGQGSDRISGHQLSTINHQPQSSGGFTLIEVLAAMAVLVILVLALTRMFAQATDITKRGTSALLRNSTGETALETLLQDAEGMVVNERLACRITADASDKAGFGFDDAWFISTSGDQDDDLPYEYFHYFITNTIVTNAQGAPYKRYSLMKDRMIMAVGDAETRPARFYALDPDDTQWWEQASQFPGNIWDRQVLADNVVRFDIYVQGWDWKDWMAEEGGERIFDSTLGPQKITGGEDYIGVPPATFDIYLQLTSPDVVAEAGMALLDPATESIGREMMVRESSSLFGRAVPITGASQYNTVIIYGTNNMTHYNTE